MLNNSRDQNLGFILISPSENEGIASATRERFCPHCGYDLCGATDDRIVRCPECGHTIHRVHLLAEPPPGVWLQWAIALWTVAKIASIVASVLLVYSLAVIALAVVALVPAYVVGD